MNGVFVQHEQMFALAPAGAAALLLRDDHRLDRRRDVVDDLDYDHVRADILDRLGQVDVVFVDLQATCFFDRVRDVLRRYRAEQAPIGAGLLRDRQDRAVEQVDVLLCFLDRVALGALGSVLALADPACAASGSCAGSPSRRRRRCPARRASLHLGGGLPQASRVTDHDRGRRARAEGCPRDRPR